MKKLLLSLLTIFLFASENSAQFQAGFSFYLDYNLYHKYQEAKTSNSIQKSSGQILNILPLGGFGFWLGDRNGFSFGMEGGIDYMPFSFSLSNYQGMGALSFPVLLRLTKPIVKKHSISPYFGIGLGMQWNRINLYGRPQNGNDLFFRTFVTELSIGMGVGWLSDSDETGLLALFLRMGIEKDKAFSLNIGLRAKLMTKNSGHSGSIPEKREREYQASVLY